MILIFDSVTLIYLGKTRTLEKIGKLDAQLVIPKGVYKEVVEIGIEKGFEESTYVKGLVDSKMFSLKNCNVEQRIRGIQQADMEALELAKKLKGTLVTDDQKLRNLALIEHVDNVGSAFFLFLLLKKRIITKPEVKSIIDKMIENGWYCSTDFYTTIITKLDH